MKFTRLFSPLLITPLLFSASHATAAPNLSEEEVTTEIKALSSGQAYYSTISSKQSTHEKQLAGATTSGSPVPRAKSIHSEQPPHSLKLHNVHEKSSDVSRHRDHQDVTVYESWFEATGDVDQDGFYNQLSLTLDIDTLHFQQDLFIDVALIDSNNQESIIFTSDDFTVYSDHSDDAFHVDSTLANGFFPDGYKVVVSIYDAYSREWLTDYTLLDHGLTAIVPMESQENDEIYDEVRVTVSSSFSNGALFVTHSSSGHDHGGHFSLLSTGLLSLLALLRYCGLQRLRRSPKA